MSFEYIPLKGHLTTSQENLLDRIENAASPYQGISCLKDLRSLTGVSVIVSDKACLKKMLTSFIEEIKHKHSILSEGIPVKSIDNLELNRRLEKAMDDLDKVDNPNVMPLLGLYTRKYLWFDDSNPYVILFADNIKNYARMHGTNVDNVFGYVFIHEMMHAYYDAFNAEGFPAHSDLEEAFAEYGMLTFINKASSLDRNLLSDASAHVELKKKHGPHEYGFGYDLYDLTGGGDPNMMNRYKDISNWIDLDVTYSWRSTGKHNYFDDLFDYRMNPLNSVYSDNCYKGVNEILDFDWKQPIPVIQRAVRGGSSSSRSSRRKSHVLPPWLSRIAPHGRSPIVSSTGTGSPSSISGASGSGSSPLRHSASGWALSATAAECSWQFKLLQSPDKMSFIAEFVKALKRDNIEAYLSLDSSNHITFLGKELCEYSSAPGRSSRILSESLCVSGTTVYPVILQPAASTDNPLTMKQFRSLLHAACVLYDAEFTVVREASGFTLYGPDSCAASFVAPLTPATGSGRTLMYTFDANSSWRGNEKTIFFHIPTNVSKDCSFSSEYIPKTGINIKFYGKAGISFTGDASILGQGRIGIRAELRDEYAKYFGKHDHRTFHFREIKPSDGTKPAEWEAHEK